MARTWICTAAALGALGVILGALGSHLPSSVMPLQVRAIFETGVRWHLVHTLALLATGMLLVQFPGQATGLRWEAWSFLAGIVLFSGSLYLVALAGWEMFRPVTPFGGLAWIGSWILLGWTLRPSRNRPHRMVAPRRNQRRH